MALVHRSVFNERCVLLVIDNRLIEGNKVVIRTEQNFCRGIKMSVIREGDSSCGDHIPQFCEFLAFLVLRHCTYDMDMDYGDILRPFLQARDKRRCINHRRSIRHCRNCGITAGSPCMRPRGKIFLRLLSGLTKMCVHINKTRYNNLIGGVIDFGLICSNIQPDLLNDAVLD